MRSSKFVEEIIDRNIKDEELRELLITHSERVARKALAVADAAGLPDSVDRQFVWDAAMLHDIGIVKCNAPSIHCHGTLPYICHGIAGAEILATHGVGEAFRRVCERHTGAGLTKSEIEELELPLPHQDFLPETVEEKLICYADKFYSKSGDPRREKTLDQVRASMERHGAAVARRFEELHRLFSKDTDSES